MKFAVLSEKESLKALTKRLYEQTGQGGSALAEKALADANPGVAGGAVGAGAIVIVPDVAGTKATAETTDTSDIVRSVVESLLPIVESLQAVLDADAQQLAADAQGTIERANDQEVVSALALDARFEAPVREAANAAKIRVERAKVLRAAYQKVVADLNADLGSLVRR